MMDRYQLHSTDFPYLRTSDKLSIEQARDILSAMISLHTAPNPVVFTNAMPMQYYTVLYKSQPCARLAFADVLCCLTSIFLQYLDRRYVSERSINTGVGGVSRLHWLVGNLDVFELVLRHGSDGESVCFRSAQVALGYTLAYSNVQTPIVKPNIANPVRAFFMR